MLLLLPGHRLSFNINLKRNVVSYGNKLMKNSLCFSGRIKYTEICGLLRVMLPPLGLGPHCPNCVAYKVSSILFLYNKIYLRRRIGYLKQESYTMTVTIKPLTASGSLTY